MKAHGKDLAPIVSRRAASCICHLSKRKRKKSFNNLSSIDVAFSYLGWHRLGHEYLRKKETYG